MIKILVVTPFESDANSFWRCVGPLSYLARQSHGEIDITVHNYNTGTIGWPRMLQYDLLFLHRPCRDDDLILMKVAHNCNVPVWVDYDDWLFDVPSWNKAVHVYGNMPMQALMAQALVSADVVTCSTIALYTRFRQINENTVLLPNAYRSDLFSYREEQLAERRDVIYWRGSDTHDGDLLSVKDAFKNMPAQLNFMGGVSWQILACMKPGSYQILGNQDVLMFFRMLYDLRPKICVFPLVDCFFNQCKSNIAYMEAIHAGAVCVAPDMPEWRREGVITYEAHNPQAFEEAVRHAHEISPAQQDDILSSAYTSMKNTYDITNINSIRLGIVYDVISSDFKKKAPSPFNQPAALAALGVLKGFKTPPLKDETPDGKEEKEDHA